MRNKKINKTITIDMKIELALDERLTFRPKTSLTNKNKRYYMNNGYHVIKYGGTTNE